MGEQKRESLKITSQSLICFSMLDEPTQSENVISVDTEEFGK